MFQGLPRWLIAFGIVVIAVIEIVSRAPDIMLLPQKLAGGAGELGAKALAPQLTEAQIAKTAAEAKAADAQAQLNTLQQAKVEADTKVSQLNQQVTQLNGYLLAAQANQAQSQARLADTQAAKTVAETKVVQLQQYYTVAQTQQAQAQAAQANAQATKTTMENVGTAVGVAALVGVSLYAANKFGLLPEGSSNGTTQTSTQTTSYGQPGLLASMSGARWAINTKANCTVRGSAYSLDFLSDHIVWHGDDSGADEESIVQISSTSAETMTSGSYHPNGKSEANGTRWMYQFVPQSNTVRVTRSGRAAFDLVRC